MKKITNLLMFLSFSGILFAEDINGDLNVVHGFNFMILIYAVIALLVGFIIVRVIIRSRFFDDKGNQVRFFGVESRVLSGFSVILLLFVISVLFAISALTATGDSLVDIESVNLYSIEQVAHLEAVQMEQVIFLERALRHGDGDGHEREEFEKSRQEFSHLNQEFHNSMETTISYLSNVEIHTEEEIEFLTQVLLKLNEISLAQDLFSRKSEDVFDEVLEMGTHAVESHIIEIEEMGDNLDHTIEDFLKYIEKDTAEIIHQAEASEESAKMLLIVIFSISFALAVF